MKKITFKIAYYEPYIERKVSNIVLFRIMRHNNVKLRLFTMIFLLLFLSVICSGSSDVDTDLTEAALLLEYGDIHDVVLTVYYMSPNVRTFIAVTVESLILIGDEENEFIWPQGKITVDGNELIRHTNLIESLNSITLVPLDYDYHAFIRIYYKFETAEDGMLLEVFMWGGRDDIVEENIIWDDYGKVVNPDAYEDLYYIYVNGQAVRDDPIFYNIIMPFLPDDFSEELTEFIDEMRNPWWR